MKKIRLNIDDREVLGLPGQTILEVAKENNIFIPTLAMMKEQKYMVHAEFVLLK